MKVFTGSEYSSLYLEALRACREEGEYRCSRVGNVYDLGPTCFEVSSNEAGLPFIKGRGLNPFFALAELAWFYQGSNELSPLRYFIPNYDQYSDDGKTLYGAYGYRVTHKFGFDQLNRVVEELKVKPESRRAVISLYDAGDLNTLDSLDIPCNLSALFKIRDDLLDITVFNRSNDVFKGIPYNFFLFRFLQYWAAKKLGKKIGVHRHITDSLHLYESDKLNMEPAIAAQKGSSVDSVYLELNIFDELIASSSAIHSLEWGKITEGKLRWLFLSYQAFKEKKDDSFFRQSDAGGRLSPYVEDWLDTHYS
ncbi:MAG: thymidylate synthase [Pseudomonadales bacterium]